MLKAAEFRIGGMLEEQDYPELTEKEGSSFEGWYTDPEFTNAFDQYSALTGDTDLYAKWSSKEDDPAPDPDADEENDDGGTSAKNKKSSGDPDTGDPDTGDPDTDDDAGLNAWIILMLSSIIALTSMGYIKRKRR